MYRLFMAKVTGNKLRELYIEKEMTQDEIAEKLGVTQPYISRKMKALDIESRYSDFWTEQDEKKLEEIYLEEDKEEIKSEFPDRTWNSIKLKAMELGVARSQEEYRKSDELKKQLEELADQSKIDVDFANTDTISYILGVVDGDGFHDNKGTIGLEVNSEKFADKFIQNLEDIGLNPGKGRKDGKFTAWASSLDLVRWIMDKDKQDKIKWLKEEGDPWKYIEGQYESDGNIHPSGSPRICSYDELEKRFLLQIFDFLDMDVSIQQNNVWVSKKHRDKFFNNINPVIRKKGSKMKN